MLRTITVEGIVLLTDRFGEIHKRVTLFTGEKGIVSVIAHGALKPTGKLKSLTELFLRGRFFLYVDPVKENLKITDAECLDAHSQIRKSLKRFFSASLCAEILLKSHGGGEAARPLFALLREWLALLDSAAEEETSYLLLQFIMRFLTLTGNELRGGECTVCGRVIGETQSAWMIRRNQGLVCDGCRRESMAEFSPGAKAYYEKSRALQLTEALRLRLSAHALAGFKMLLFLTVQDVIERELSTIEAGKGVL